MLGAIGAVLRSCRATLSLYRDAPSRAGFFTSKFDVTAHEERSSVNVRYRCPCDELHFLVLGCL